MKCPICDVYAPVTKSYKTPAAISRSRECPKCFRVLTSMEVLMGVDLPVGEGAKAVARKLMRGHQIQVGLPQPPADEVSLAASDEPNRGSPRSARSESTVEA